MSKLNIQVKVLPRKQECATVTKEELFSQRAAHNMEALRITIERGHYTPDGKVKYTKRAEKEWSFSPGFSGRHNTLHALVDELYVVVKEVSS